MADNELYGAGGDKYAGYATTIPMDEEEEDEEPRPGIGGPRCVAAPLALDAADAAFAAAFAA
jgi:hypothetical protein